MSGTQGKDDEILFPWQLKASGPRKISHPPTGNFLARGIIDPLRREVAAFFSRSFIYNAYSELYFENQFTIGAALALERFFQTVSVIGGKRDSSGLDDTRDAALSDLRNMLTRPLYERLVESFNDLQAADQGVSLHLQELRDARISELRALFGPDLRLDVNHRKLIQIYSNGGRLYEVGKKHRLFQGFSVGTVVPPPSKSQNFEEEGGNPFNMAVRAMEQGAQVQVQVTFDADIRFSQFRNHLTTTENPEESTERIPVCEESCKREFTVLFEGKHISEEQVREGKALSTHHWRIADIDNLLESELYDDWIQENENDE
ncbi:hypothetical protein DFS34DRAFT_653546 [Phlyctochytrium arcticum]|nr:hypothetical protein DFS34DRAFT_653546 [Phlyctochytrium arcticum]